MSFTDRLLFTLYQSLKGSHSLEMLREMEGRQRSSRSEILEYQFRRLSALLADAESHVPYYREMFKDLGIRSADIRSLSEFDSLPVLTKDIIRERGHDLIREGINKDQLKLSHSGGSTGVPLSFYHDLAYGDFSEAGTFRNLIQCGWGPGETIAYVWGGNDRLYTMSRWRSKLRQYLRRRYQFDPFYSGATDMDGWLRQWQKIKPSVVFGYASTVARFAVHIQNKGERVRPLKGVFTTAEKLYRPQREIISEVFGCHVYDCYGSSEVRNIAAECSRGRMHVNSDCVVLEVDRKSVEDDSAPFIVTSLWNRVMPFIRYRNEDCGRLVDGSCECGSNFPLMDLNIGRVSDNFVLPGGRVVHGEFFTHLMYGSDGISSFQFHQTALDSIILWVVPVREIPTCETVAFVRRSRRLENWTRLLRSKLKFGPQKQFRYPEWVSIGSFAPRFR